MLDVRSTSAPTSLPDALRIIAMLQAEMEQHTKVVTDLLLEFGTRRTCAYCGMPVIWARPHNTRANVYNPDGTHHWPRCPRTERPTPQPHIVKGVSA